MVNPRLVEIEFLDKRDARATWVYVRVGSMLRSGWVARDSTAWLALMHAIGEHQSSGAMSQSADNPSSGE